MMYCSSIYHSKQLNHMKQLSKAATVFAFLTFPLIGCAQQQVDNDFIPKIDNPLYEKGKGPVVMVDGAHHNFHTLEDKFAPFGKIVDMAGFRVRSNSAAITAEQLKDIKILVIANALNEKNVNSWQQPVHPAFTPDEVKQISTWVHSGGSLFLIADHMPFPGAVMDLTQALGFTMYDGFALCKPKRKVEVFSYGNGMLKHSQLTDMHGSLDSIVSFTGQAFKIPAHATSVVTLDSSYKILMPEVAWEFDDKMKIIPAEGLSQLAYANVGEGRVVVSGEAAMFTAQTAGDKKMGLNADVAANNIPLLLNILEWLSE